MKLISDHRSHCNRKRHTAVCKTTAVPPKCFTNGWTLWKLPAERKYVWQQSRLRPTVASAKSETCISTHGSLTWPVQRTVRSPLCLLSLKPNCIRQQTGRRPFPLLCRPRRNVRTTLMCLHHRLWKTSSTWTFTDDFTAADSCRVYFPLTVRVKMYFVVYFFFFASDQSPPSPFPFPPPLGRFSTRKAEFCREERRTNRNAGGGSQRQANGYRGATSGRLSK